jgi:hypothetical protein
MAAKPTNRWPYRRRRVQEEAEALALKFNKSLPTDLGAMAHEQGVREIDFRPLIVDGGLSLLDDGFLISVRCEENEGDDLHSAFEKDSTGRGLPPRARFTIAHEIAHTFFFDRESSPPKTLINYKDRRVLPSLENACSRAARQLLIPEFILRDFAEADFLQPTNLRRLADDAFVSPPAVIVRFSSLLRIPMPYGLLMSVDRAKDRFTIGSVSQHEGFRNIFSNVERGALIDSIVADREFVFNGGDNLTSTIEQTVAGQTRRYTVAAEDPGAVAGGSCFLTITWKAD